MIFPPDLGCVADQAFTVIYLIRHAHTQKVSHVRLKDPAGEVSVFCLGQRFKSQLKFQLTGPRGFLL